ncbi:MAG: CDP-glycerol glycerophosphotransferase family protein, partial [Lachnospiraceae bacterium]|nr:CDP-glycerol glycerophosphotransferase family protein [Lachnospiraceae bacterium]
KWCLISRYHRYQTDSSNVSITGKNVLEGAAYPDMQELLCAADVMITDYSSCVWDYAFLERPCVLFVPDKEEYVEKTGFYVGLDEWPFPQTRTVDTLCDEMEKLLSDKNAKEEYDKGVKAHLTALGSYETGEAAKGVAQRIKEKIYG